MIPPSYLASKVDTIKNIRQKIGTNFRCIFYLYKTNFKLFFSAIASENSCCFHPKYQHRLAALCEQKYWKAKAIEYYEKFFDIWKDADPEIAEVKDVRERLSKQRG